MPQFRSEPHVSQELLERARTLLRGTDRYNTKRLREDLNISGARAGAVFRALGWVSHQTYEGGPRGKRYIRPKEAESDE
jgi:hypothetical protein